MKNYYKFKIKRDNDSINYYYSLNTKQLKTYLNKELENIEYHLNYYALFFKQLFKGNDYDQHYYSLKSLSECINDIKIMLNILKEKDNND